MSSRASLLWILVGTAEFLTGATMLILAQRAEQGKTRVPGGTKPRRIRTLRRAGALFAVIGLATAIGLGFVMGR